MSNYLEIDSKILEKNLLLETNTSDPDNLENFFLLPENCKKDNASWTLVTPTAGFCVKTTDSKNKKVFINLCKLSEIPEPKDVSETELLKLWQSDDVSDFRIPLSIQEPRDEFDKAGNPTVAYDVAVNTKFFQKIETNVVFRSFVMQVVMEGIENKFNIELKKEGYLILRNRKCLGELKPHRIRKTKLSSTSSKPLIEELHSANTSSGTEIDSEVFRKTPLFRVFENTRSNVVIVEFHFSHLVAPDDLKLNVNENRIVLDHQRSSYSVDFFIPIKVDENNSTSFFNFNTNVLTVKMPEISTSNNI